jgi:FAD/FMN-containing dehydrogenase
MPRTSLPRLTRKPKIVPFKLGNGDKQNIARTIGADELSPEITGSIEWNVSCLRATQAGSKDCTIANVRFALRQLEKKGRARRNALELLSHDRAAVDDATLDAIQPLAKAVLAEKTGTGQTLEALLKAARQREAELSQHPRIAPASEPFRYFCGTLRVIFLGYSTVQLNKPAEKAWHRCRCFAQAVFDAAQIEYHDFVIHPQRLTEFLKTDVTVT